MPLNELKESWNSAGRPSSRSPIGSRGSSPEKSLCAMLIDKGLPRLFMKVFRGRWGPKLLVCREIVVQFVAMLGGILPVKRFESRAITQPLTCIKLGIVPSSEFPLSSREKSFVKLTKEFGSVPVKPLESDNIDKFCSLDKESGMVPVSLSP